MYHDMYPIPVTTALCQGLAAALSGLRATVANHIARAWHLEPLLALIYHRLTRMALRLDRLTQRWQAGTLPRPRHAPRPAAEARPRLKVPPIYVPQGHAWLIRHVQPTAQYTPQLEHFLADPQTRALVAAAPQAGRLLRPLCRMLAIAPPDWLRLPPRPKPAPPFSPAALARREPEGASMLTDPPKQGTPDRPLPPYIRAAVRAWKRRGA